MSFPARSLGALFCLVSSLTTITQAQVSNPDIPRDNQRNRWFNWEVAPMRPLVFTEDGSGLYTFNQPGSRIVLFDTGSTDPVLEIPAGLGLTSLALRPGTLELWVVDSVTNSISIVDRSDHSIVRTIQVGTGPHAVEFTASGDRAYVSCSTAQRVDVIRTDTYEIAQSIDIPARDPRGLVVRNNDVRVVAFSSGNGTAPRGNPATGFTDDIVDVRHVGEFGGTQALPDRDLFRIVMGATPGNDTLDTSATISGLGTTLYNLHRRPGTTELWIPHTEALNADFVGERNFPAGQVVQNRIAVVRLGSVTWIDLDQLTGSPELRSAPPTYVAFDSTGQWAYVTGYGSDTVTILDLTGNSPSLHGTLHVTPARNYPDGSGPRAALVSPDDEWLAIFNKGDNTISWVELSRLPSNPGFDITLEASEKLGWNPFPANITQGRVHFRRTTNSLSGTTSCDTCHVDGHTDFLAWDLSAFLDPEGTARDQLALPLDNKGPMVTQSGRSLREVGPWHWRGERHRLRQFNTTFIDLMERHEEGVLKDLGGNMFYITQYLDELSLYPNPRLSFDRLYSNEELDGADVFLNTQVEGTLSCNDCHTLPLGTTTESMVSKRGGLSPTISVPSLRGVADKLSPPFVVGGDFGTRTELGAGLNHGGNAATIQDLLLQQQPPPASGPILNITPQEADRVTKFLEAFDTGLAPAATWMGTAHPGNVTSFFNGELSDLMAQADAGNCEIVYRYGPVNRQGSETWMTGAYDASSGRFVQASAALPTLTPAELIHRAATDTPVTFVGVPHHMSKPMGLDRDNDDLFDLDELDHGTSFQKFDTDKDGFPDGYEVLWGMDPLVTDTTSPDAQAPQLLAPVEVIYTTSRGVKFEFETDELTRVLVSFNGSGAVYRAPLVPLFDRQFSLVLNELEPDTENTIDLSLSDPSGNERIESFTIRTKARVRPEPVHVERVRMRVLRDERGLIPDTIKASVILRVGDAPPPTGYVVHAALYHDSISTGPALVTNLTETLVRTDGKLDIRLPVPPGIQRRDGEFVLAIQRIVEPNGAPPHVRGDDLEQRARAGY